jgi:hypothetical protein
MFEVGRAQGGGDDVTDPARAGGGVPQRLPGFDQDREASCASLAQTA